MRMTLRRCCPRARCCTSPRGTTIRAANPNNPDPDQWVGYGDRTVDEMAHAWVNVTYISEADYADWSAQQKAQAPERAGAGTRQ